MDPAEVTEQRHAAEKVVHRASSGGGWQKFRRSYRTGWTFEEIIERGRFRV